MRGEIMKAWRKCVSIVLSVCVSAYTLPVFAGSAATADQYAKVELTDAQLNAAVGGNGSVDATMSDYTVAGSKATAVIANRIGLDVNYSLYTTDTDGVVVETLASGTLAAGQAKIISGTPSVGSEYSNWVQVEVKHLGVPGLSSVDSSWAP
jgi:hypothetical protein